MSAATTSQHASAWRFSLKTLLALTAYSAFATALLRWTWDAHMGLWTYYGGPIGSTAVGVLLWACFSSRKPTSVHSTWRLLAVGWLLAVMTVFDGLRIGFSISSAEPGFWSDIVHEILTYAFISATTIPVLCTLPALYALLVVHRSPPDAITWRIFLGAAVAGLDALLWVLLTPKLFAHV